MKTRTNFLLIALFALGLMAITTTSCNKDPEPMVQEPMNPDPMNPDPMEPMATCDDGIQNGNETGIDCGGDCAACETTVDEDKSNVQTTFDNMLVCVDDMTSAKAIDVLLRDFFQMSEGEVYNEDWVSNLSTNFENVFDFEEINTKERFYLPYHAGKYFYDHASQAWAKEETGVNTVRVEFPSSPDLSENNAVFVIDNYSDQNINLNGDNTFAPKTIHAFLNVDGQKIMELSLDKVTFSDNTNYEAPVEIDASLYLAPMLINLDVQRNSSTEFYAKIAMNDGNYCSMALDANVTLKDDDFENLSSDGFEKIDATLRVGDLKVQSLANLAQLLSMDEPDESTINSLLDLDVLFKEMKIADLEYSEEEENFILYFKDQSSESAGTYVDGFLEDLEALIVEFTGEW